MDWTDEVIERLKALWAEGLSTAEIGRRMGISKNAVVGKAHRLALPARPSPIRRGASGETSRRAAPRRGGWANPSFADRPGGGAAFARDHSPAAACAASRGGPPGWWPPDCVLLADWRAWHAELPLLRRSFSAGEALLRGPCGSCLREGARPSRGSRLGCFCGFLIRSNDSVRSDDAPVPISLR